MSAQKPVQECPRQLIYNGKNWSQPDVPPQVAGYADCGGSTPWAPDKKKEPTAVTRGADESVSDAGGQSRPAAAEGVAPSRDLREVKAQSGGRGSDCRGWAGVRAAGKWFPGGRKGPVSRLQPVSPRCDAAAQCYML